MVSLVLPSIAILLLSTLISPKLHSSFLPSVYRLSGSNDKFLIRQVPGDGGCLFHAIAVCLRYRRCGFHKDFDPTMRRISDSLRQISVDVLMTSNCTLVLEGGESTTSDSLLRIVGEHYNMTCSAYCKQMRQSRTWGGGPEIVAICNFLKRPIYVYELGVSRFFRKSFELRLCASFGTPDFSKKSPLTILCADGRFPDVKPGSQKKQGDHFLAMFPFVPDDNNHNKPVNGFINKIIASIRRFQNTISKNIQLSSIILSFQWLGILVNNAIYPKKIQSHLMEEEIYSDPDEDLNRVPFLNEDTPLYTMSLGQRNASVSDHIGNLTHLINNDDRPAGSQNWSKDELSDFTTFPSLAPGYREGMKCRTRTS